MAEITDRDDWEVKNGSPRTARVIDWLAERRWGQEKE